MALLPIKIRPTRLTDAVDAGYRLKMPLYHGTNQDIKEFSLSRGGSTTNSPVGKLGVSLALDPDTASEFAGLAGSEGANVIKVYHRASKPARIDLEGNETDFEVAATVQDAWDNGHDAIMFTNYTTPKGQKGKSFILVKDPAQIRSVNANFDPKKAKLPELLASIGAVGVGVMALDNDAKAEINDNGGSITQNQEQANYLAKIKEEKKQKAIQTPEQAAFLQKIREQQFDLEKFNPADFGEDPYQPGRQQPENRQTAGNLALEAAAAFNRAPMDFLDWLGPDLANAMLERYSSSKARVPTFREDFPYYSEKGAYAGEGLGTDIAAGIGEGASMAATGGVVLRKAAKYLPELSKLESPLIGTFRELAKVSPTVDVTSGASGGAGQVAGQEVGGDAGGLVGGIVGGVTGAGLAQAGRQAAGAVSDYVGNTEIVNAFKNKFARQPQLIEQATGLPVPAFQKALEKKGMNFGSIVDDVKSLPAIRQGQDLDSYVEQIAIKKLKNGTSDPGLADKMLNAKSELIPDDLASDAIKNGWGRSYVGAAKGAEKKTKNEMVKMLNIKRKNLNDASISERPLDIAGDAVFDQFKFVRSAANGLRNELDSASKNLKGKQLDTGNVENTVVRLLEELNLSIPDDILKDTTMLKNFLSSDEPFKTTIISADNSAKNMIRTSIDLLTDATDDAFNAHILKRQLDSLIDWGRADSKLTPQGEKFIRQVRHAVNEIVRDASPDYAKVNDKLSNALQTMESLTDNLSKSARDNIFSSNADDALGQELRKLESNYSTRAALESAVDRLEKTANSLGGDFDINIRKLVNFNNAMDDRFGATAKGSFAGQTEIGTKAAIRAMQNPYELLKEKGAEKILKFISPTDEQALNTMQRLLRR